jgi:hypothetical protein
VSNCYSQQPSYITGSYCNDSYQVYNAWIDYCIQKVCNSIHEDVVFCSNTEPCTAEVSKQQIAIEKCKSSERKAAISVRFNGKCTSYDSICIANMLKKPNEYVYECQSSNISDCLNDPDFFSTYVTKSKSSNDTYYCKTTNLVTQAEFDTIKNVSKVSVHDISKCNGATCNINYCKRSYCKNLCKSTEMLYWGTDCNYYESQCELECLGIDYFDFFDITKLSIVCKDHPMLNTTFMNFITLKKNLCLNNGRIKLFNTFTPALWKLYTDCYRLGSKDLADCKNKCRKWAADF